MCKCGTAFVLWETVSLGIDAGDDIPPTSYVESAQLTQIIATTKSPRVEVTARRNYWRDLNDEYRVTYRAYRDNEQALEQTRWVEDYYASLPAWQRLIRRLLKSKPPNNFPRTQRPFSAPPYTPTPGQLNNMARLLTLILSDTEAPFTIDWLEVAELYREQGLFGEAKDALGRFPEDQQRVTKGVISGLVDGRSIGPVRFRI